ncbi:MAG TPA: hypothetical protein ENL02_05030, partial [Epsilonproteobacteria bacterium]|nr:hypothetical protein [Campylobacterota bacterium]
MKDKFAHAYLKEDKARRERWAYLTEGIEDNHIRWTLEVMLDNEANAANRPQTMFSDTTTTTNIATFTKFALPLIRRIYPASYIYNLISVQPLTGPTGKAFYLDAQYGTAKAGTGVTSEVVAAADGSTTEFEYTVAHLPVGFGSVTVTATVSSAAVTATDSATNGVLAGDFDGTINYNTGKVTLSFGTAPDSSTNITIDYTYDKVAVGDRADQLFAHNYSDDTPANSPAQEMNVTISGVDITTTEKALKTIIQMEAVQDMYSQFGLRAENELATIVANQIRREIEIEIAYALLNGASAGNVNWSATVPSSAPWTSLNPKDWAETMVDAMIDADTFVWNKRWTSTNWAIMSGAAVARLEKLDSFKADVDSQKANLGLTRAGVLRSR